MKSILRSIKWIILTQAILCIAAEYSVPFTRSFSSGSSAFTLCSINKCVKIEVEGSNKDVNYFISAYQSSSSKDKRIQLAQSFNGISTLYLNKQQTNTGSIYIEIECSDTNSCSGTVKGSSSEEIELQSGEPINYFVTEQTKTMEFN